MASSSTFADVAELSASSASDFGGASDEAPAKKNKNKKKRRRDGQASQLQMLSGESGVRAMLGRPKCHCKQQCLSLFQGDTKFAELCSFRREWSALHKLDQDHEVSRC